MCKSIYHFIYSNFYKGNSYKVLKDLVPWDDAKLKCESEGAELASIRTSQEWEFIKGL